MGEIKFRARYKNEWVYFTIDDLLQINQESMTDEDYAIINHDPLTRCLYTCRQDKNDRDIYYGDIVRMGDVKDFYFLDQDLIFSVEEENGSSFIGDEHLIDIDSSDIEIIGNKTDNPEFLEEK